MIKLCVEEYCQDGCPNFEAEVDKDEYFMGPDLETETTVTCANHKICRRLIEFLESRNTTDDPDDLD